MKLGLGSLLAGGAGFLVGGPAGAAIAAGGVMGDAKANREADALRDYNIAQSEITRYSPWTGMSGQVRQNSGPSGVEGAFAGGIQGAAMAQGLGLNPSGKAMSTGMGSAWDELANGQTRKIATLYGNNPFGAA